MHNFDKINLKIFIALNLAFRSSALRIATLIFLFIERIRIPAFDELIGILRKMYGRDLVRKSEHWKNLTLNTKMQFLI